MHFGKVQSDFANRVWARLRRYRGANSYHNSNRMTFMRVPAWRAMLLKPGATAPYLRRGASLVDGLRCQNDATLQPAGGCLLTLHACSGLQTRRHHDCGTLRHAVAPDRGLGAERVRQQVAAAGSLLQQAARSFAWGRWCCGLGQQCGHC